MAITSAVCTSFKKELLERKHDFNATSAHTFKIALFTSSATLGASTTNYTTTNEVVGTGYTAGGVTLTNIDPTSSGTTAFIDFNDATWTSATITAAGALIYNTTTDGGTGTTNAVAVISFGGDKTSTNGDFVVQFPTADATNAIVRIA
jgi:predicted enzyme related to lactoylglutathione lyase